MTASDSALFDMPPEEPLPPQEILVSSKMTLNLKGLLDLSGALFGKEEDMQAVIDEYGVDRQEAAHRVISEHFYGVLGKVTQDETVFTNECHMSVDFEWSEETAAATLAAIEPQYPKRFIGDA